MDRSKIVTTRAAPPPAKAPPWGAALRLSLVAAALLLIFGTVYQLAGQIERTSGDALELSSHRLTLHLRSYLQQHEIALRGLVGQLRDQDEHDDETYDGPADIFEHLAPFAASTAPGSSGLFLLDRNFRLVRAFPDTQLGFRQGDSFLALGPWEGVLTEAARGNDLVVSDVDGQTLGASRKALMLVHPFSWTGRGFSGVVVLALDLDLFARQRLLTQLPQEFSVRLRNENSQTIYQLSTLPVEPSPEELLVLPIGFHNKVYYLELPSSALIRIPEYRYLTVAIGMMMSVIVVLVYLSSVQSARYTTVLVDANEELVRLEELHREMTRLVHQSTNPLGYLDEAGDLLLNCFRIRRGEALFYLRDLASGDYLCHHADPRWPTRLPQEVVDEVFAAGRVREPIRLSPDIPALEDLRLRMFELGFAEVVVLPLTVSLKLAGVVFLMSRVPVGELPEARYYTGQGLAITLAFALENSAFVLQQKERADRLQRLQQVSRQIATNLNPVDVLDTVVTALGTSFGFVFAGIWLYEATEEQFSLKSYRAAEDIPVASLMEVRPDRDHAQEFQQNLLARESVVLELPSTEPAEGYLLLRQEAFRTVRSLTVLPLVSGNEYFGLLALLSREILDHDLREILETLAHMVAVAIQDAARFEDLSRANQALSTTSRHKSLFLAKMSHELKTPLGTIIGFTDVLQRDGEHLPPERARHFLQHVANAASHLQQVISDMLDHSKIEAGTMEVVKVPFQVDEQVDLCVRLVTELSRKKNIRVTTRHHRKLPTVVGDPTKFRQVLVNLISNAVKFSPEGSEVLVRTSRAIDVHREWVEISVQDRGIGMRKEDLGRIFDEFSQVDDSPARRFEGTGLGLSLVKKLLFLMKGVIQVNSEPGQGSTFTVRVPVEPPAEDDPAVVARQSGIIRIGSWE